MERCSRYEDDEWNILDAKLNNEKPKQLTKVTMTEVGMSSLVYTESDTFKLTAFHKTMLTISHYSRQSYRLARMYKIRNECGVEYIDDTFVSKDPTYEIMTYNDIITLLNNNETINTNVTNILNGRLTFTGLTSERYLKLLRSTEFAIIDAYNFENYGRYISDESIIADALYILKNAPVDKLIKGIDNTVYQGSYDISHILTTHGISMPITIRTTDNTIVFDIPNGSILYNDINGEQWFSFKSSNVHKRGEIMSWMPHFAECFLLTMYLIKNHLNSHINIG